MKDVLVSCFERWREHIIEEKKMIDKFTLQGGDFVHDDLLHDDVTSQDGDLVCARPVARCVSRRSFYDR
jgi:hypothetical protein